MFHEADRSRSRLLREVVLWPEPVSVGLGVPLVLSIEHNRAANEMFVFGGGDSGIMSVPGDLWVFVLSRFGRRLAK